VLISKPLQLSRWRDDGYRAMLDRPGSRYYGRNGVLAVEVQSGLRKAHLGSLRLIWLLSDVTGRPEKNSMGRQQDIRAAGAVWPE